MIVKNDEKSDKKITYSWHSITSQCFNVQFFSFLVEVDWTVSRIYFMSRLTLSKISA